MYWLRKTKAVTYKFKLCVQLVSLGRVGTLSGNRGGYYMQEEWHWPQDKEHAALLTNVVNVGDSWCVSELFEDLCLGVIFKEGAHFLSLKPKASDSFATTC